MKVFEISTSPEQPLTDPSRNKFGITFALRGGDVYDKMGGKWFEPPYPRNTFHVYVPWKILPWISWNLWGWCGYVGFKCYGVDSPEYKNWIPEVEVFDGSLALCSSMRFRMRT